MKRVIRFSKGFVPAAILSAAVIAFGLVGLLTKGLNLGVDFQAGINQSVQLAFPVMEVSYAGKGNATLTVEEDRAYLVFSGAEVENRTETFLFAEKATIGDLAAALDAVPDIAAAARDSRALPSSLLVPTFQSNPVLGPQATVLHRAPKDASERFADIEKVRAALKSLGEVSVQVLNPPELQRFIIRMQDEGTDKAFSQNAPAAIRKALEAAFGAGRVVGMKTDYVGARYSESLGRQSIFLVVATTLMILLYATIRFKLQFGLGAILAIVHDALVMIAFIVWTRMSFNTATIAAILTILGYSINDTIVQFDRVREDRKLRPMEKFRDVLDEALSETLGRTIITTATTMLTVLALFFFTSGSIHDFALALFVGMISGTYSTIFIASGFVDWWEGMAEKRRAKTPAKPAETPAT